MTEWLTAPTGDGLWWASWWNGETPRVEMVIIHGDVTIAQTGEPVWSLDSFKGMSALWRRWRQGDPRPMAPRRPIPAAEMELVQDPDAVGWWQLVRDDGVHGTVMYLDRRDIECHGALVGYPIGRWRRMLETA